MLKASQIKIEKFYANQNVAALFIALISFLLINKKIPTTTDEMDFIQSLKSYRNKTFYLSKGLPLPALIHHGLYNLSPHLYPSMFPLIFGNVRLINFFVFVLTMLGIFWLSQKTHNGVIPWIVTITHIISLSADSPILLLTGDLFAIFFLTIGIIQLKAGRSIAAGISLGLSVSSSWSSISIYPPLAIFSAIDIFSFVINPNNRIYKAILKIIKAALVFVAIPISVYLVSFWIHYSIQEYSSEDASKFSVEFQSTLKNDTQESADKYLMDRSIVTILNQKHRTYLSMEVDTPFGSDTKSESSMWTIIKVHLDEAGDAKIGEENRYVSHGDLVKLVGFNSNMCLRVINDDTDDKFKKVLGFSQNNDSADEDDIWQVSGDGYVLSRKTLVKFKHYKTSMELCVRDLQKIDDDSEADMDFDEDQSKGIGTRKMVNGSLYSENNSRLFYISDNRNHEFFKKNFEDGRPKETVLKFPKKSFITKVTEHHEKLRKMHKERWIPLRRYILLHLPERGQYRLENNFLFNIASVALSFLLPVLIVLNHISHKKYGKGLRIRRDTVFVSILYLCANSVELLLNTGQTLTSFLRIWVTLAFALLFGTKFILVFFSVFLSSSMRLLNK